MGSLLDSIEEVINTINHIHVVFSFGIFVAQLSS